MPYPVTGQRKALPEAPSGYTRRAVRDGETGVTTVAFVSDKRLSDFESSGSDNYPMTARKVVRDGVDCDYYE